MEEPHITGNRRTYDEMTGYDAHGVPLLENGPNVGDLSYLPPLPEEVDDDF